MPVFDNVDKVIVVPGSGGGNGCGCGSILGFVFFLWILGWIIGGLNLVFHWSPM